MATKNTPPQSEAAVQNPTPENTPVPGGGRWRWDIAAPGWVAVDEPDSVPVPVPETPLE